MNGGEGGDVVRQAITLSRILCASNLLETTHSVCAQDLRALLTPNEVRAKIGVPGLFLWTVCSREKSSSIMLHKEAGHLVIDAFQLRELSRILFGVCLDGSPDALAKMFLGLFAEDFLRLGCAGLSEEMLHRMKRYPQPTQMRAPQPIAKFMHDVQRWFVLCHELGHVMLDAPVSALDVFELRALLCERIALLMQELECLMQKLDDENNTVPSEVLAILERSRDQIADPANRYREELLCDTLASELLRHRVQQLLGWGTEVRGYACVAILATAFGLDLIRFSRTFAEDQGDGRYEEAVTEVMYSHTYFRLMYLAKILSVNFQVDLTLIQPYINAMDRALFGAGGFADMLRTAQRARRWLGATASGSSEEELATKLIKLFTWTPAPDAIRSERIF